LSKPVNPREAKTSRRTHTTPAALFIFVEPIPALGIVPLRKTPKTLIPQTNRRTLGPAPAGRFLVRLPALPAIVLRQHHTQPFSCEDEEPRPNSA